MPPQLPEKTGEPTLRRGALFGDYEILAEVDRGGMGIVYQAWSFNLRRIVALKLLDSRGCCHPKSLARFQREIEASARLSHPNIIAVHDAGRHEDAPFLVMEFAENGSLEAKLGAASMPPAKAARLIELLAQGVDYAHKRGIIHRDLKPHNILLCNLDDYKSTPDRLPGWAFEFPDCPVVPKIADFGLAKLTDEIRMNQLF